MGCRLCRDRCPGHRSISLEVIRVKHRDQGDKGTGDWRLMVGVEVGAARNGKVCHMDQTMLVVYCIRLQVVVVVVVEGEEER